MLDTTNTLFCANIHQYILLNANDGKQRCPGGREVPESECLEAAKTFSSITVSSIADRTTYHKGEYDYTPCGCFLWKNPYTANYWAPHYDSGGEGCASREPARLICMREFADTESCSSSNDRHDYRGKINVTRNGFQCQRWDSQSPHPHQYTPENYPNYGLDENYCRNPDEETGSWCFTTDLNMEWDWCDVPSCPLNSYQAEDASISPDGTIDTEHPGFAGSGYVNMGGRGSWIEWSINSDEIVGGPCELDFRYASEDSNNRECQVTVTNGTDSSNNTLSFAPTGSWSSYEHDTLSITCPPGLSRIRLTASTNEGGPNVDYLKVDMV